MTYTLPRTVTGTGAGPIGTAATKGGVSNACDLSVPEIVPLSEPSLPSFEFVTVPPIFVPDCVNVYVSE